MKGILIFVLSALVGLETAGAAVRDGNAAVRQKSASDISQRVVTTQKSQVSRGGVLGTRGNAGGRSAATARSVVPGRSEQSVVSRSDGAVVSRTAVKNVTGGTSGRTSTNVSSARSVSPVVSRAASDNNAPMSVVETRTGAAYEQCKNAYFTCMDQFCKLKNDDYRRCSCSNRVYDLTKTRETMQEAGERLTVFTENLDVVGMTAAQATAMKTASDGENALTADSSASKALLQAIMNSIRGEDSNVGGKYSGLNSINIAFDATNAFGIADSGQAIAAYNGQNLYTAVYPQCRSAVRADCNDASLQRAITAYLMAIEQDCNTVQTAIEEKQKQMKAAVREGGAMLDLARVENRQKHNSDDIATCVANVEAAILSEEVCGANYHRCLDNGEFIDISTGTPIAGVSDFYKLGDQLSFPAGVDAADQKLTRITANRLFVQNFEKRVKKFAQPALDKCVENADDVWADYLDKAMLDIYYAQQSKVAEIKQGCFDFVSACYMNGDTALTKAMTELTGDDAVSVQPHRVVLSDKLCKDYVESCNNMFDDNIVKQYIENRTETDTLTACRAVVKQCFDKYGGSGYENFYYPYSGLFTTGRAPDWFTLYEIVPDGEYVVQTLKQEWGANKIKEVRGNLKSECAKQLTQIDACNNQQMIESAFGGFDLYPAKPYPTIGKGMMWDWCYAGRADDAICKDLDNPSGESYDEIKKIYGMLNQDQSEQGTDGKFWRIHSVQNRYLRPTGVATEVYNQVLDILTTQCTNLQGRFVQVPFIRYESYGGEYGGNYCIAQFDNNSISKPAIYRILALRYGIENGEDICPRDYNLSVDTASWGACLCWENGGRRSKWGTSAKCVAAVPAAPKDGVPVNDAYCDVVDNKITVQENIDSKSSENWCTVPSGFIKSGKVCLDEDCKNTNLPSAIQ